MQAVILAGGNAVRSMSISAGVHKAMLPLFDRPVLEHTIILMANHGIDDITVCISPEHTEIAEYFGDGSRWEVKIRYMIEHEPRGTAGAVKLLQKNLNDTFLVLSCDATTDFNLTAAVSAHKNNSALATILLHEVEETTQYGVVRHDSKGLITHFFEKPKTGQVLDRTVNTGIYIFEPNTLSCIAYDEYQDFALHVFPRMLANQEPVYAFEPLGFWQDAGILGEYNRLHAAALTGRLKLDLIATEKSEGVWIGKDAKVHSSAHIAGPAYIGAGAEIKRGAILSEGTVIGAESIVEEGAELINCVIGRCSHIGSSANLKDCIFSGGLDIAEMGSMSDIFSVNIEAYAIETKKAIPTTVRRPSRPASPTPSSIETPAIHVV